MVTITGTLNSEPGHTFLIDFFSNAAVDSYSGTNGEGQTYLGSYTAGPTDLTTGDLPSPFSVSFPLASVPPGQSIFNATIRFRLRCRAL